MTQGGQQSPAPGSRWHSAGWWQAVAGISGVLAVVVAVITYVLPRSADGGDKAGPTPTSVTSSGPSSTPPPSTPPPSTLPASTTPPAGPTSGPDGAAKVRWSGDFLLRNVTGVDLDPVRPTLATGPQGNWADGDLHYWNPDARDYALYAPTMAEWDSTAAPSFAGCDDALATLATGGFVPAKGDRACVRTTDGRTAFVSVKTAEYDNLRLTITVWET